MVEMGGAGGMKDTEALVMGLHCNNYAQGLELLPQQRVWGKG